MQVTFAFDSYDFIFGIIPVWLTIRILSLSSGLCLSQWSLPILCYFLLSIVYFVAVYILYFLQVLTRNWVHLLAFLLYWKYLKQISILVPCIRSLCSRWAPRRSKLNIGRLGKGGIKSWFHCGCCLNIGNYQH